MANRDSFPVRANMKDIRVVSFKVVFDADVGVSAGVDATEVCDIYNHHDHIASHERTGEGDFKFFLRDKWYTFEGAIVNQVGDADYTFNVMAEDVDNTTAGSGYVQLTTRAAGSAADPDGLTVHVTLFLGNSTTGRTST